MNYKGMLLFFSFLAVTPLFPAHAGENISWNYAMEGQDKGRLEQFYRFPGPYKAEKKEISRGKAEYGNYRYTLWHPTVLKEREKKWPLVICLNGTGGSEANDEPLYEHLASWGFLVLGNDDSQTGTGWSAEYGLEQMEALEKDKGSFLYGKVDMSHVGLIGYSQGGAGAWHALDKPSGGRYATIVTLSAVTKSISRRVKLENWLYDTGKAKIPVFMISGDGLLDRKLITPLPEIKEGHP